MSKPEIDIQEDDLHAYVDNQLSQEKRKAVEELMRNDSEIAQQIHQWQLQNKAITSYFNDERFTDIPEQLNIDKLEVKSGQKEPKPQKYHWYYAMAASLFLMVASGYTGWFVHDLSQPGLQNKSGFVDSAISAYEVYSVEVLHPVEVGADNKDHLLAWLSKRIDHPLDVPDLHEYGYKLLGGRLLAMKKGRPAAQFMYEDNEGQRITLLVSKSSSYNDHAFLFKKENTVNSFYWMDANVAYSVSGEVDRDHLHKLSQDVYQQINEKHSKQLATL